MTFITIHNVKSLRSHLVLVDSHFNTSQLIWNFNVLTDACVYIIRPVKHIQAYHGVGEGERKRYEHFTHIRFIDRFEPALLSKNHLINHLLFAFWKETKKTTHPKFNYPKKRSSSYLHYTKLNIHNIRTLIPTILICRALTLTLHQWVKRTRKRESESEKKNASIVFKNDFSTETINLSLFERNVFDMLYFIAHTFTRTHTHYLCTKTRRKKQVKKRREATTKL